MIIDIDENIFRYNKVVSVNNIPIVLRHEICKRWSNDYKTQENEWCFLTEKWKMKKVKDNYGKIYN